ncbi:folate family ECF transporter S component [Clostridium sp. JNZ J1-5]
MNKINKIVYMGLLISLEIILTRFLSIQTPIVRIGFGFLPIVAAGVMFGPILAGITAAIADVLGMLIFPQGAYFPGFTLSAFIGGVVYGNLFYKKSATIIRSAIAVGIIIVFVDLVLNTYWLTFITGKAATALIIPRLTKSVIMFPIQTTLIYTLWKLIIRLNFMPKFNKA